MKPWTPRPYQTQALDFLRRTPRANLFAGMGLGKTVTVESLVAELQSQENTLVLAPLRVARKTWSDEASEWEHLQHLKVACITGTPEQRTAALKTRAHIHTVNYDNIEWLLGQLPVGAWPFTTVVADESTRLKGFRLRQGGRRAGALATVAHRAKRWINLTGTPNAKGLRDLWGQQWFVDRGAALGSSYSAFEARWFYKSAHGGDHAPLLPFAHSQPEIEAAMRPTTLAIRPKDWFDLKDPIRTEVRVQLPPAARREYRRMARELYAILKDGTVRAVNAATKSGKLLQIASGAVYHEDLSWSDVHDEKIDALRSIVSEAGGAPVLVAYHFKHMLARILKAFPGARQLKTKKDEDDWNAGKIEMLVAHPDSAGHGLNLQHGGNILVYMDHTWRVESYLQILERIGPVRQMQSGYDRPVFVYSVVADQTADEAVIASNTGNVSAMDALMASLRATI
jgi:SNF2 family DNA or RNA helicase